MVVIFWVVAGLGWLYFWLRGNWFVAVVTMIPLLLAVSAESGEPHSSVPLWAWCLAAGVPWVPFAIRTWLSEMDRQALASQSRRVVTY